MPNNRSLPGKWPEEGNNCPDTAAAARSLDARGIIRYERGFGLRLRACSRRAGMGVGSKAGAVDEVLISQRQLNRGIWSLRCNRANCPPHRAKPCWLRPRARAASGPGIDLVGYLLSEIGLGEAARLLVGALDAAAIPAHLINVPLPGRQSDTSLAPRLSGAGGHPVALSVSGLMELVPFAGRTCRGQANVHYTYWELPTVPQAWSKAFDGFDAFWAPTTFIRDMLVAVQDRPVHLVPQPVRVPAEPPRPRPFRGPLRILTLFDYESFISRKNPQGAVAAFRQAFPAGTEDVELIVKARGAPQGGAHDFLAQLVAADRRIRLIDATLPRDALLALIESCDVFLSLHRSEGFSLGCAEALARGKAVVATRFGGTRDFVTPSTGYPVDFREVPVAPEDYPAAQGSHWAEPELDHAAQLLKAIYDDPEGTVPKGQAGYHLLKSTNAFEPVGARIRTLLEAMG